MDAFENVVAAALFRQGYWVVNGLKVELTKEEKRRVGRPSMPRAEPDVVAYSPPRRELLVVECKSFLDSGGVLFRDEGFGKPNRYKLFTDDAYREVVFDRLKTQLVAAGHVLGDTDVRLALAAGNVDGRTDLAAMRSHFDARGWTLFDPETIRGWLVELSQTGYANDTATVVAKLLLRGGMPA